MRSFSFNQDLDENTIAQIHLGVESLRGYFIKFCRESHAEAMQWAIMHAIKHYSSANGSLIPYLKVLARCATKQDNGIEVTSKTDNEIVVTVDDFSNKFISDIVDKSRGNKDIVNLALSYMEEFVSLCEDMSTGNLNTQYTQSFIKHVMSVQRRVPEFNSRCLRLYNAYKDDIALFMSYQNVTGWKEYDKAKLVKTSKRHHLYNLYTGNEVEDADIEEFYLRGSLSSGERRQHLIRIEYETLWEDLCDRIDAESSNELKLIIGESCIITTPGGSLSLINPDLYQLYDLIRGEIVTNLVIRTGGKLLNIGRSCVYLLVSDLPENLDWGFVRGIAIQFNYSNLSNEDV